MKWMPLVALSLVACQATGEASDVPWLRGLTEVVSSTRSSDEVGRRFAEWSGRASLDPGCPLGSHVGIELTADVAAASPGRETILVSLAHGIAVFDRHGALVTETPGYRCEGSADELEAVAVGKAHGERTLVIAATTGGHRSSSTWVTLLRIDDDRRLDAVFTGTVEEHDREHDREPDREHDREARRRGTIVVLPDALLYRHPNEPTPTLWVYDADARAYLPPGEEVDRSRNDGPLAGSLSTPSGS
jgi:hypothetical protein